MRKMSRKNIYSLSDSDSESLNDNQNKIELLSCRLGSQKCKEHLRFINKNYTKAVNYELEKDYLNSIEMLKDAFYKAVELQESQCAQCSSVFRSTIAHSLENINKELLKMTSGVFRRKRYLLSYKKSLAVLNDFKQNE